MRKILILLTLTTGWLSPTLAQDSLSNYLELAMENNPSIRSAYEAFHANLERSDQAGILPDPTLGIGYFVSPVETRVGPQQFRFSLTQMFPWIGTLAARREQMDKQAEASYWLFAAEARSLVQRVRASYYELWVLHNLIELQQEDLTLVRSIESLATTRFRSGEGRLAEVLRVQLDLKSLENAITRTRDQLETKTSQFFLLLNARRDTLHLPDTIQVAMPVLSESDSLSEHPEIRANMARSQAAVAYAEVARKQGYPSLGLGMDYMIIGKRNDVSIPDNGKNAFMPMVTIGLPLWRKKYTSMKNEAEAMERQYLQAAQANRNMLFSEREEAVYALIRAQEDMRVYAEQIELAERMLRLTETDFANDQADFDNILEYQEKLLQYRKQHLVAYGELLSSLTRYEYVTGENPAIMNELMNDENQN